MNPVRLQDTNIHLVPEIIVGDSAAARSTTINWSLTG